MTEPLRYQELIQNELLARLNRRQAKRMARLVEVREVPAGTALVEQGKLGREFFLIIDGKVTVGTSEGEIGQLGAGQYFGEIALIGRVERTATVTAATPARLGVIGADEFQALIETEPRLAINLLRIVIDRYTGLTSTRPGKKSTSRRKSKKSSTKLATSRSTRRTRGTASPKPKRKTPGRAAKKPTTAKNKRG